MEICIYVNIFKILNIKEKYKNTIYFNFLIIINNYFRYIYICN